MRRSGKPWWITLGNSALLTLIGSAMLIGVSREASAAPPPTDTTMQFLFSATLFGNTSSDCRFGIPAMGVNLDAVTVSWSGACVEGRVSGSGTLRGVRGDQEAFSYAGDMRNGMPDGEGIYHLAGVMTLKGRFQGTALDDEHATISTEK